MYPILRIPYKYKDICRAWEFLKLVKITTLKRRDKVIDRGFVINNKRICSLTISDAGWRGKRRARRGRHCRRSIGVGIPRYQASLLHDRSVVPIFHPIGHDPSRFSAIFNVGRDQTVPYPRITGRRELEPYSGISLKLETNASRLVEVVVAFRGAHFRNSVPVDRGSSPSSSRPNLSEISRALFPSNERAFDPTTPHSGPLMKKLNHVGDLVWIYLQIIFFQREKKRNHSR